MIDKQSMQFFPEDVQKLLNDRLEKEFTAERPYEDVLVEAIKDKFKEWDRFKVNQFMRQVRSQFNIR